jgi:urease accessory protein UreF
LLEQLAGRSMERSLDEVVQTSPVQDLWQGTHDRLASRLFQS